MTEEQAIKLTIDLGFDGRELNSYEWRNICHLNKSHKPFIDKLNFLFESVEVIGKGKNRTYILKGVKNPIDEEQAINITIENGYTGNEFQTAQWKNKGYLDNRDSNTLIKKIETIYDSVGSHGKSDNRLYLLEDKKEKIVLNQNFIKNSKGKKKAIKPKKKPIENKKPKVELSPKEQQKISDAKRIFLNDYFNYSKKSFREDDKKNMLVDVNFEPKTVKSKRAIKSLYKKHQLTFDWEEFISIVMLLVTEAVQRFQPTDKKFKWDEVNTYGSVSNLILHKYVNNSYINEIGTYGQREQNKSTSTMWITENGNKVKKKVIIENKNDSVDIDISLDDGDSSLMEILGNEHRHGYQHSLYHPNQFLHWFNTNKDNLLAESQKEFIDVMSKHFHEAGSKYTKSYSNDPTHPFTASTRRNRMYRIRTKINELYYEEFPNGEEITFLQMKKESDMDLLNGLLKIVYDTEFNDADEINEYITYYIHDKLNNPRYTILSDMLHDSLSKRELIQLNTILHNGFILGNKLIYKIVSLVESKIEQLERFDTSVSSEELRSTSGWTKEDHQKYKDYLHAFKNESINVYDIKTGKLVRREKYVPDKKNYKVMRLDTYGLRHE